MNFFYFILVLFTLTSYSQDKIESKVSDKIESKVSDKIESKVSDTIIRGYFSVSPEFIKVIIIKTDTEMLIFENVVPGDEMYDYYTMYSNDNKFRFDIYEHKVIVYTINTNKTAYIKLYIIEF